MFGPSGPDNLSTTTDVVLGIRLVLSQGGQCVRGAVVDPEAGEDRRFVGLAGLCNALGEWLAEAQRKATQLALENEDNVGRGYGSDRTIRRRA